MGTSCARTPYRILKYMTALQVISILRGAWQVPVVMSTKTTDSVKLPLALESYRISREFGPLASYSGSIMNRQASPSNDNTYAL